MHPSQQLDDVVQQRVRLGVLTVLTELARVDFPYLRGLLEVTDGNLATHLRVLEETGYVHIDKAFEGRRPRTWISITPAGRHALEAHMSALKALIAGHEEATGRSLAAAAPCPTGA